MIREKRATRAHILTWAIAGALGFAGLSRPATATMLWDADGNFANGANGGTGTWNAGNQFWDNLSADVAWSSGATAEFGGTAGTVTVYNGAVPAPINVGGIIFDTTGYTLTGGTLTLGSGATVQTTATATTETINTTLALTADGSIFDTAAGTNLTAKAITGNFAFTKQGAGTLTLNTGNSARTSGAVTLTGGVLSLGVTTALGAAGLPLNLNGGTLDMAVSSANNTFGYNTTVGGTATITGTRGTLGGGVTDTLGTLSIGSYQLNIAGGANVNSGTAKFNFGSVNLTGSPTIVISNPAAGGTTQLSLGAITDNGNSVTLNGNGNFVQSGPWTGTGGLTTAATYSGIATLSQTNGYSGGTVINGGTVTVSGAGNLGAGTGALAVNNPTTGAGTAVVLNLNSAQTIGSLSGAIATPTSGTNTATINLNGFASILTDTQTTATSFGGVLAGSGGLTLSGAGGALTLTGANTYGGATTITNGTLILAGNGSLKGKIIVGNATPNAASLNVSGVTGGFHVVSGQTLAGQGTIIGNVTINSGGILSPDNSIGTLSINNALTLTTGSVLTYDFNSANSTYSSTNASGLNLTAGTAGGGDFKLTSGINPAFTASNLPATTYHLIGYNNGGSGTLANFTAGTYTAQTPGTGSFTVSNPQPDVAYIFTNNTANHSVDLNVSQSVLPQITLGPAGATQILSNLTNYSITGTVTNGSAAVDHYNFTSLTNVSGSSNAFDSFSTQTGSVAPNGSMNYGATLSTGAVTGNPSNDILGYQTTVTDGNVAANSNLLNLTVVDPANITKDATGVTLTNTPNAFNQTAAAQVESVILQETLGTHAWLTDISAGTLIQSDGNPVTIAHVDPLALSGTYHAALSVGLRNDATVIGSASGDLNSVSFSGGAAVPTESITQSVINNNGYGSTQFDSGTSLIGFGLQSDGGNHTIATLGGGTTSTATTLVMDFHSPKTDVSVAASDAVKITGLNGETITLEMTFDPTQLLNPTAAFLGRWNGANWQLATAADNGGTPHSFGDHAYNPSTDFSLGSYGYYIDPTNPSTNSYVWAVVNNVDATNGNIFAAIPEPSSLGLLLAGSLGLLVRRGRKSRR